MYKVQILMWVIDKSATSCFWEKLLCKCVVIHKKSKQVMSQTVYSQRFKTNNAKF